MGRYAPKEWRAIRTSAGAEYALTIAYDLLGRLPSQTDANGTSATMEYDFQGRMTTQSDPDACYGHERPADVTPNVIPGVQGQQKGPQLD